MKKTFTLELIKEIVETTKTIISTLGDDGEDSIIVDGVELKVSVKSKVDLASYYTTPRKTATITYGKMVLGTGLDAGSISNSDSFNMLYVTLAGTLGPNQERIDMNDLTKMVQYDIANRSLTNPFAMSERRSSLGFSVTLPGDVRFARSESNISITKGEELVYSLFSTNSNVLNQQVSLAASLALGIAGSIEYPPRTVDVSIESAILNGILYVKDGDKVAYYFDDTRTHSYMKRQSPGFGQFGVFDPTGMCPQINGPYDTALQGY